MEVTTVSPSPASPTEGDDLCEIDVTKVAMDSVTLLISLCGLVGNGAVLCLISLKDRSYYIFYLAFADFFFLLFTVPSALLFLVEDRSCSPVTSLLYFSFLFQMSLFSCCVALFLLTFRINIGYMHKLCMLCCHCDLPKILLWLVYCVLYWGFFVLFAFIPAVTNLCLSHQQHCRAALISMCTVILLLFAAPMVISSTVEFIKAKCGSKQQQPKRRDIVLFLTVLIVLLLSLCDFLHQFGYIALSFPFFFLFNCIQTSFKPFIYFLAGRCWSPCALSSLRLSLWRVFDEQEEEAAHSSMEEEAAMDTGI